MDGLSVLDMPLHVDHTYERENDHFFILRDKTNSDPVIYGINFKAAAFNVQTLTLTLTLTKTLIVMIF